MRNQQKIVCENFQKRKMLEAFLFVFLKFFAFFLHAWRKFKNTRWIIDVLKFNNEIFSTTMTNFLNKTLHASFLCNLLLLFPLFTIETDDFLFGWIQLNFKMFQLNSAELKKFRTNFDEKSSVEVQLNL